MNEKAQYVSQSRFDELKKEYNELKNVKILEIADVINEAKQQGDLSENAEYHQAKEEMAWAQGRLLELEQILGNCVIINGNSKDDTVSVGKTIVVEVKGVKKEYTVVGPQEANPFEGLISNESPLGQAFLGHKAGDKVDVETPSGKQIYTIKEVKTAQK